MLNGKKYKTAAARKVAFQKFCSWANDSTCRNCPLFRVAPVNQVACAFDWLELDADKDALPPCPVCGSNCYYSCGDIVRCMSPRCYYACGCEGGTKDENRALHAHLCEATAHMKIATKERMIKQ